MGPAPLIRAALAGSGDTEKTLSYAFSAISERYLQKVSVAQVALDSLAGLATVDPAVSVTREGGLVRLRSDGRMVTQYAAPADGDALGWTQIAMQVMRDGRRVSEPMARADDDRLMKVMFDMSLNRLDQFSRYSAPSEARSHRASRNGFAGVGIRYEDIGPVGIEIRAVIPESPAEAAHFQVGDVLTHVDGRPVRGMGLDQVSEQLRGEIGSQVSLTLLRKASGRNETIAIRRSLVVPPTVTMTLDDGVANIRISGFNQRTAASLTKAVQDARSQLGGRLRGVLLDLRGNPGGLLDQAVTMADLFMAHGRIVSTQGRHRHANQVYDASPGDIAEDLPLAVLVDGKSASASEILTAALQDAGRAVVIGTNSYGKGTVQTVIRLPNDGEMTLTWSRFHSPTGYALHGLGVLPTICTAAGQDKAASLLQAVERSAVVTRDLAKWRASDIEQVDQRKQLRTACPPEKHGDDMAESRMAEQLLADQALYARALSLSLPTSSDESFFAPAAARVGGVQAEVKAR